MTSFPISLVQGNGTREMKCCFSPSSAVLIAQHDVSLLFPRKLVDIGWTKEYINQMVKEKAVSETESIYGTLYGTLGEDSNQENM